MTSESIHFEISTKVQYQYVQIIIHDYFSPFSKMLNFTHSRLVSHQSHIMLYNLDLKSFILSHSRISLGKEFHNVAP